MPDNQTATETPVAATPGAAPAESAPGVTLPGALRERFNGQLDGHTIVAWAEFDLDDQNHFARQFAVLSETDLFILGPGAVSDRPRSIAIKSIEEAKIIEGLGVDRLTIFLDGKPAASLRYSRSQRRDVTRLHRKLMRRVPKKDGDAEPVPDWLEVVERREEQKEHCPKCGELIPAYAEGVCPRCLQKRKILLRLLDVAKPYRAQTTFALVATLLLAAMGTVPPYVNRHLIDDGIVKNNFRTLLFWGVMVVLSYVVLEVLSGLRLYTLATVGTNVARDLRHMVYSHMHELSLRYFAKRRTGSLITRVTNDTDRLWDFIVFGSVDVFRNILMITFISIVMVSINWRLALVSLLPLPLLACLTYVRGMRMQKMHQRLWTYWSRLGAVVGDALPGVRVVKAFANEHREIARFDRRSDEYTEKEQDIHRVWTRLQPVVSGTMRMGQALVWIVGGYMVIRHPGQPKYSLGTLVMFTQYLMQFYGPIMELANSSRMVTRAASSAQRVFEVLDTPPEIYSTAGAVTKDRLEGRVEFRSVSFSYEGAQPALRDISLSVEPGEMIGLCGPSGAGKSTFVNMLCRFYDPTDGQILIDDIDIRDYDVKWLRRQIGMVLQEPYLFHGTIADNIRYGNPSASEAEVIRAARAANAHDFIVSFPDGYDTMVGERGQSLSGGERQRISIARAILHNPRLLILDEATSSVDTETEKQIQQALDRLVEGRTTFAIAHRLSTLQAADRLIVLEKGKLVEQGLHAELVNKEGGVYAKLHRTQMEMSTLVAIR
jgi:ATP-binding cassette subfamily B protein